MFTELLTARFANMIKNRVLKRVRKYAEICGGGWFIYGGCMRRSDEAAMIGEMQSTMSDLLYDIADLIEKGIDSTTRECIEKGELKIVYLYRMVYVEIDSIEIALQTETDRAMAKVDMECREELCEANKEDRSISSFPRTAQKMATDLSVSIMRTEYFKALTEVESHYAEAYLEAEVRHEKPSH